MRTSLQGRAEKAKSQAKYRFRNLYGMRNEELLKDCWRDIRKDAAYGVDEVSAQAYEQDLDEQHQPPGGATEEEELPGQTGQTALYPHRGRPAETCRDTGRGGQTAAVGGHAPPHSHLRAGFPAL